MAIYETRAPGADRPLDHVEFGPATGAEIDRRLLGDLEGRHVLVLGGGAGHDAVGLSLRGALVTAVDPDPAQLSAARHLAAQQGAVVGFHQAALADLAFVRAEQIDVALSVGALSFVDDLDRVLRQVHRVLGHGAHFVMSVPHPAALCADPVDATRTVRCWDDGGPVGDRFVHRAEDLVTALHRANFEVDALLEPHSGPATPMPTTLIARGRKLGA